MAHGTYHEVMESEVDFLNLMRDPDKDDDLDETLGEGASTLQRRFSRQMTCPQDELLSSPLLLRQHSKSFGRQVSHSSRCTVGESVVSVANDTNETVVYVSQWMDF